MAEIALQVYDTYETAQTVLDPCASLVEKGTILGLYVFGLALPGGGYSTAGKTGIQSVKRLDQADDLRQTFKLVDRTDDTRAATRIGDEVDEIDTIKVVDDLCFNSFSAETLVSTEDGLRPISEVVIGDWVWAYHEGTGEYGLFPVTDVIVHTDPAQVHLLLDGELLETTPEHPFYTLERGWVDAGDLWVGAHIRQANGSYGRVQFLAVEREDQVMYNLTVDEAHTFFVGAQRWLVHNSSRCGITTFASEDADAFLDFLRHTNDNMTMGWYDAYTKTPESMLVYWHEGKIIGAIHTSVKDNAVYVDLLEAIQKGQGVGTKLLKQAAQQSIDKGLSGGMALRSLDKPDTIAFYKAMGGTFDPNTLTVTWSPDALQELLHR